MIKLHRGVPDRLLPKDFLSIVMHQYFPVLSLTYVTNVCAVVYAEQGSFFGLVDYKFAYVSAFFVALWVSIPAFLWMVLKGSNRYPAYADVWYKILAVIMSFLLLFTLFLVPELNVLGLKSYTVASLPIFIVMYLFFVKGVLTPSTAHPLTFIGAVFMLYGCYLIFV
jgi:hypothetical protein